MSPKCTARISKLNKMNINQHDKSDHEKEAMLEFYSEIIAEHLVPSHIIPDLAHVLDNLKVEEILAAEKRGDRKLASTLTINYLKNSMCPGWLTQFITALENASFKLIVGLIEGRIDIIHHKIYKNLLNVFYSNVAKDVDAPDILPHLIQCECLTNCDSEDIIAVERSCGRGMACLTLLTRIGTKNEHWFPHFMYALKSTDYSYLVEDIEPLFITTSSLAEAESVGDKIIQENKLDGLNTKPNVYSNPPDNKQHTACQDVVQDFNKLDLQLTTDQPYDEVDIWPTHSLDEKTVSFGKEDVYSLPTCLSGDNTKKLFSSKSVPQLKYMVCGAHKRTRASDVWCLECGTKFYNVDYEDIQNRPRLRRCISCVCDNSIENTTYEDPDQTWPHWQAPERKTEMQDNQCSPESPEQSTQLLKQNNCHLCGIEYQNIMTTQCPLNHPEYTNCGRTKLSNNKICEEQEMISPPVPPPRKKKLIKRAEKAALEEDDYQVAQPSDIDNTPTDSGSLFQVNSRNGIPNFGMNFELDTHCDSNVNDIMNHYNI